MVLFEACAAIMGLDDPWRFTPADLEVMARTAVGARLEEQRAGQGGAPASVSFHEFRMSETSRGIVQAIEALWGGAITTMAAAIAGRLMYHSGEVRARRRFFGPGDPVGGARRGRHGDHPGRRSRPMSAWRSRCRPGSCRAGLSGPEVVRGCSWPLS